MNVEQSTKDRILAEETYRAEVRKQLEAENVKSDGKLHKFLNSSFGLWLLSAVFISGAGTIYQNRQKELDADRVKAEQRVTEEINNRQAIERLDIEISFRLSQGLLRLSTISGSVTALLSSKTAEEKMLAEAKETFSVVHLLTSSALKTDRDALYPEYSNYSLPALLAELRRRLPEPERSTVESSLASLGGLATKASYDLDTPASMQAAALIHKIVLLPRWRRTAFYYIDCDAKTPFC